jgi:hypothetical protein
VIVVGGLESPSLFGPTPGARTESDAPPAYELKFLIPDQLARDVADRLAARLAPDPHADPAFGGAYRTTSIYTDTPRFDVFRRNGGHAGTKFRARRYGSSGPVFLERKEKDGDRVWKCRATVAAPELARLARPAAGDWVGEWFHTQVAERGLAPVCRIAYERVALMGPTEAGPVRVTFDRNIRGEVADGWDLAPVGPVPELLPGLVVCEFKFRVSLPAFLKEIVGAFGLTPTTVSKYRRFVRAAGLAGEEPGAPVDAGGEVDA